MLGLKGSAEPEISVSRLEAEQAKGRDQLVALIKGRTRGASRLFGRISIVDLRTRGGSGQPVATMRRSSNAFSRLLA